MSLFLLILFTAAYYIRPAEWVEQFTGYQIILYLSIILLFSVALSCQRKSDVFSLGSSRMMLWFTAMIVMSHVRHTYMAGAITSLQKFAHIPIVFFSILCSVNSKKKIRLYIWVIILLGCILAAEGVKQYLTGTAHGGMTPYVKNFYAPGGHDPTTVIRIRWYGIFNDPNDLSLALIITIPYLVNYISQKRILLCAPPLFLVLIALYFTNSRGGFIAAIFSIFFFFVFRYRSKNGIITGIIASTVLFMFGPSRIAELSAHEGSAYGRIEAWYEGFQMLKSYPLFGVGSGMFTDYHIRTAHNSFVLIFAELGLLGALAFVGIFYYPFRSFIHLYQNNKLYGPDGLIVIASMSSLIGLLFAMYFLSRSYILLPYMMCGITINSLRIHLSTSSSSESKELLYQSQYHKVFITLAALLSATYFIVRLSVTQS